MTYDQLRAALNAYMKRTDPETVANEPVALELARVAVGAVFFPRESELYVADLAPLNGVAVLPADFGRAVSVGLDMGYVAPRVWHRLQLSSPRDLAGRYTIEGALLRCHAGLATLPLLYNRAPVAIAGAAQNWLSQFYPPVWLHAARAEQYRFIEDMESGGDADRYWTALADKLQAESERSRQSGGALHMKSR